MNLFSRKTRPTREELRLWIESSEGYLAGFELRQDERGPWVWINPVGAETYLARGPNVLHCEVMRPCTPDEVQAYSNFLSHGDIVLRVIYVRTEGRSRFAVLRID